MTRTDGARAPRRLRCEHLHEPLGIDVVQPRLSWQAVDERPGADLTGYQVLVASDPELLAAGTGDRWDTGHVRGAVPTTVRYAGAPLASRDRCWWQVRTWDGLGQPSPFSAPASFEMGLLTWSDWHAAPVRSHVVGDRSTSPPAPYLRRGFHLAGDVAHARLIVTAFGLYEAEVNGQRVGDDVYRPGWTDYRIRLPYQVYDVTDLLTAGENAVGAILGDGWWCGHLVYAWGRQAYGDRPALIAQLEVTLVDGTREVIATDGSWRTSTGPILASDTYHGEHYDARRELGAWSQPGYDDTGWDPVEVAGWPLPALVGASAPPVRRLEQIALGEPREVRDGVWRYDVGQNIAGRVRLRLEAEAGTTVELRHAEALEDDGTLHVANLRGARATDRYVGAGRGVERYEPRFTYHGFRYVELSGPPNPPPPGSLEAVVLGTDTPRTGTFRCSHPGIQKLQDAIARTQRNNTFEVLMDCQQRAERLGWSGDLAVFTATAAFNADVAAFLEKCLVDLTDGQLIGGVEDGQFPAYAPRGHQLGGGPGWSDAGVVVAWELYLRYGDLTAMERHEAAFHRWMDHLARRAEGRAPGAEPGFGDWMAQDVDPDGLQGPDERYGGTPRAFLDLAWHVQACDLMARVAQVLGRDRDRADYLQRGADLRRRFAAAYLRDDHLTVPGQTARVLALRFGLLPEAAQPTAFAQLAADLEERGHLTTGFLGTPHLLDVLTDHGRLDLAYGLLEREERPSWLFPITQGATTMWERWDGWTPEEGFHPHPDNSFSHVALGAVGDWMYRVIGGLAPDPAGPGFERVTIAPRPGGSLTWASTEFGSVRGPIQVDWRQDGDLHVDVSLPVGVTAQVVLPAADPSAARLVDGDPALARRGGEAAWTVPAGRWAFVVPADGPGHG